MSLATGSFISALLQDPVVVIELCAVVLTFSYIFRLSMGPLAIKPFSIKQNTLSLETLRAPLDDAGCLYLGFTAEHSSAQRRASGGIAGRKTGFHGLFGVGQQISLPKRSLLKQRLR